MESAPTIAGKMKPIARTICAGSRLVGPAFDRFRCARDDEAGRDEGEWIFDDAIENERSDERIECAAERAAERH